MADNVLLNVRVNGAEAALAQLAQIDSYVKSIKGTTKITINASGITKAANSAEKLAKGLESAKTAAGNLDKTLPQGGENTAKSLGKANKEAKGLSSSLGTMAGMIKFRAINAVINGTISALGSAVNEMKNVDTELVNIRKVTRMSDADIKKLTNTAYDLASAYGRTASEVLTASTVFARAGYTDQIASLSELSLLLQNAGDLSADDAAKFIIATDAAYKFGGSTEKLTAVIDGLDNITNKNATDMQKMTDGMTIAGSVFAESGESVEMFAALLGSATAATQRSGSEVARGLRTIVMNLRQIRGETEDGELIDGESIAAAATALRDYAGISTMENGELRKASDVLTELAGKWDTLSETQRAAIAEAVAGKRQANILMALMGDWESVEKMMGEYESGAGTAAAENAAYMESWAAQIEVVKAQWNDLVQSLVDSDAVVGSLKGLNQLMEWFGGLVHPDEKASKGLEDQREELALVNEEIHSMQALKQSGVELNETQKERLEYLKEHRKELKEQIKDSEHEEYLAWQREHGNQAAVSMMGSATSITQDSFDFTQFAVALNEANAAFANTKDIDAYRVALSGLLEEYQGTADQLSEFADRGEELSTSQEQLVNSVSNLQTALEYLNSADYATQLEGIALAAEAIPDEKEIQLKVSGGEHVSGKIDEINAKTQDRVWTITLSLLGGAALGGISSLLGFASGTDSAPGGPALVNENGPEIISANGLAWIAGGGNPAVVNLPRGASVLTAEQTRRLTGSGGKFPVMRAYASGSQSSDAADSAWDASELYLNGKKPTESDVDKAARKAAEEAVKKAQEDGKKRTEQLQGSDSDSDSSDGDGNGWYDPAPSGPKKPNFKKLEKELDDRLKNLDLQAELAENEGDYLKAMELYGDAQDYIAELIQKYKDAGYADDSDEILTLANLGYDYASKQLGDYDELQKQLIDALNDLTRATDNAAELAEKQAAVDKARETLANAERQRTVRVFNPVTGQWEWVANAADIQKAQENLQKAEESLQKTQISQAIEAIQNAKPEELAGMQLTPALLGLLAEASPEQQAAFIGALDAAYGGAEWLSSPEAETEFNQGGTTNIGAQNFFEGIQLTDEQAASMTIADLLAMLHGMNLL
jgi:TP901 family phage tail tape measure protein